MSDDSARKWVDEHVQIPELLNPQLMDTARFYQQVRPAIVEAEMMLDYDKILGEYRLPLPVKGARAVMEPAVTRYVMTRTSHDEDQLEQYRQTVAETVLSFPQKYYPSVVRVLEETGDSIIYQSMMQADPAIIKPQRVELDSSKAFKKFETKTFGSQKDYYGLN